ncbi:MAG: hypothetical protein ACRBFS_07845 [Aureispira sp.]
MSNAVTISGSTYTIKGTVKEKNTQEGILDLHVIAYDKDILYDDFLGIAVTDINGVFSLSFDSKKFKSLFDRAPDLYFIVKDGGLELLNTGNEAKSEYHIIKNATEATPAINFSVEIPKYTRDLNFFKKKGLNDSDALKAFEDPKNKYWRQSINKKPVSGWTGGFEQSNPAFSYPNPDLSSLGKPKDNMANINKLQRQQKVLWPEFSWISEPAENKQEAKAAEKTRCYQMFAPDISRLGYTNEGRVYSIICPQQGTYIPYLGTMNVEVTVTGNKGWVEEGKPEDKNSRALAADMGVEAKIWFSQEAQNGKILRPLVTLLEKEYLGDEYQYFPSTKEKAIVINTFKPGFPNEPNFPLLKDTCTNFDIPEFAKHEDISWSIGHLAVQIGAVRKTGHDKIDHFNQMIVDIFNMGAGNMLKENNVLTWNVWFTAPELVDTKEWEDHANYWRESIDVDHASPDGPGTTPRYFDGTPFTPMKTIIAKYLKELIVFIVKNYFSGDKASKEGDELLALKDKIKKDTEA